MNDNRFEIFKKINVNQFTKLVRLHNLMLISLMDRKLLDKVNIYYYQEDKKCEMIGFLYDPKTGFFPTPDSYKVRNMMVSLGHHGKELTQEEMKYCNEEYKKLL